MRSLALLTLVASMNCAVAVFAHAATEADYSHASSTVEQFAKESFSTLYTLPRSAQAKNAFPALLHDEAAWQAFLERNYTAPRLNPATPMGSSTTYTFPDVKQDVTVTKDAVIVSFSAIQEVRNSGYLAAQNCFESILYLDMPNGVDDLEGATVKEALIIMEPMDQGGCEATMSE